MAALPYAAGFLLIFLGVAFRPSFAIVGVLVLALGSLRGRGEASHGRGVAAGGAS